MKDNLVVVSRFNEDTEWVKDISSNWGVMIFNKGSGEENKLENVGREAHTYLYFIVKNYHKLPKAIAFMQGNPFDHNRNIIVNLNNYSSEEEFTLFEEGLTHTCDASGSPDHPGLPIDLYAAKHGIQLPDVIHFSAGAQFIVTKEAIQQRSLNFYKELLDTVSDDIKSVNAYILERLWMYIFNI